MPSPFPGMDPFIESQRFDDFHYSFIMTVKDVLVPLVRPKYVVDAQRYVFLSDDQETEGMYAPDVSLSDSGSERRGTPPPHSVATLEPRLNAIAMSDEAGQIFLTIRSGDEQQVVTVIEVLSPTNKTAGKGQREYLAKRANYLRTLANVVEIDLLRGGARLPMCRPLQEADYFAFVIRHGDPSNVEEYGWELQDRLPVIPVPLREGEPDVGLDLQAAFDRSYDRSGYDYALNYQRPIAPPLPDKVQRWVEKRLTEK